MTHTNIDWTHKNIRISDIRKLNKLYVFKITRVDEPSNENSLFVKDTIFEERVKSFFLKEMSQISREDILGVNWNMYITKGYYIKIDENGNPVRYDNDPEKWYVSYLEIDGPLGSFCSIYRDREIKITY